MKIIREKETIKSLDDLFIKMKANKIHSNHNSYHIIKGVFEGYRTKTMSVYGSGRRTKYVDHSQTVIDFLEKYNITFQEGNDAPRGGAYANYIELTQNYKRKFKINRVLEVA